MTRALAPVVHAACSCTRSGDRLHVTSHITFDAGMVSAVAPDDAAVDACLQKTLEGHFAPAFAIGSDCIDCGPKRYPVFRGSTSPAAPSPRTRVVYPFTLVHR